MRRYLPKVGFAIVGIISLALGLIPVVDSWPRWILIAVGAIALVGIALQLLRDSRESSAPHQSQTAGSNSRLVQGGGDVTITGDLGDKKP